MVQDDKKRIVIARNLPDCAQKNVPRDLRAAATPMRGIRRSSGRLVKYSMIAGISGACVSLQARGCYDVRVPISAAIPPKKTAKIIASTMIIAAITSDARQ